LPFTAGTVAPICVETVIAVAAEPMRALVVAHVSHETLADGLQLKGPDPMASSVTLSPAQP
jgi:hypothetical protein